MLVNLPHELWLSSTKEKNIYEEPFIFVDEWYAFIVSDFERWINFDLAINA